MSTPPNGLFYVLRFEGMLTHEVKLTMMREVPPSFRVGARKTESQPKELFLCALHKP